MIVPLGRHDSSGLFALTPIMEISLPGSWRDALANFQFQIEQGESMGIVQMYETAARNAGNSPAEINAAREQGRKWSSD